MCAVNAVEISLGIVARRCHLLVHLKLCLTFETTGIQSPNIFSFFRNSFVFVGLDQEGKR